MIKLCSIKLKNFRCYRDEKKLTIGNLTSIIGKNDAGKSAILEALSIFFENNKIDQDDASVDGNNTDVRITCEFSNFPGEIILDSTFPTSLKKEYLLNSNENLEIVKIYDCSKKIIPHKTYAYCNHPENSQVCDLLSLKNADLKKRLKKISPTVYDNVDLTKNAAIREAILKKVQPENFESTEISLDEATGKDIWKKIKEFLPIFCLFKSDRSSTDQDSEAQDPMKSAVKEALKANNGELEKITEKVKKEVSEIAKKTVEKINEIDQDLAKQLKPVFSPPKWENVFKISITGDDEIPLNKRGSGIRRMILLSFFRAKSENQAISDNSPRVIYAIEQPETSQHPDSQKKIIDTFLELSESSNCQLILTTHTPTLARYLPQNSLRFIEVTNSGVRNIHNEANDEVMNQVANTLGVLSDNNIRLFIGCEGKNDVNFLKNISKVLKNNGRDVVDLKNLESRGEVIFFPIGGKSNLAMWKSKLEKLNKPEFFLFDRDAAPNELCPHQNDVDEKNRLENSYAVVTKKRELENYIHSDAIYRAKKIRVKHNDASDVPELVAKELYENKSEKDWINLKKEKKEKKESSVKKWLNQEAVLEMNDDLLHEIDPHGEVIGWLNKIKEMYDGNFTHS